MTGQEIFDRAIHLMAESDDSTGATVTPDTQEYKVKSVGILNVLINECYPWSDTFTAEDGKRGVLDPIYSLAEDVDMDDFICGSVLPYGLAAELLKTEDGSIANYLYQRYREMLELAKNSLSNGSESIIDIYGIGSEYNEFSRW